MKAKEKEYEVVDGVKVYPIPGYPNYGVTKCGRVWSRPRKVVRKKKGATSHLLTQNGGWLTPVLSHGYHSIRVPNQKGMTKTMRIHTLVTLAFLGGRPLGKVVDHINRINTDNRLENLRYVTPAQNLYNASKRKSRTGFRGVAPNKNGYRFQAYISKRGSRRHLGCFATAEEAAKAYDEAALRLHGEFANLNFPK